MIPGLGKLMEPKRLFPKIIVILVIIVTIVIQVIIAIILGAILMILIKILFISLDVVKLISLMKTH